MFRNVDFDVHHGLKCSQVARQARATNRHEANRQLIEKHQKSKV